MSYLSIRSGFEFTGTFYYPFRLQFQEPKDVSNLEEEIETSDLRRTKDPFQEML